jgi:hypothetical protein
MAFSRPAVLRRLTFEQQRDQTRSLITFACVLWRPFYHVHTRTGTALGGGDPEAQQPSRLPLPARSDLTEGAGITSPPRREASGRHHRCQPC